MKDEIVFALEELSSCFTGELVSEDDAEEILKDLIGSVIERIAEKEGWEESEEFYRKLLLG